MVTSHVNLASRPREGTLHPFSCLRVSRRILAEVLLMSMPFTEPRRARAEGSSC